MDGKVDLFFSISGESHKQFSSTSLKHVSTKF